MTDTRDEGALKPCPFCGYETAAQWAAGSAVECHSCGAEGPVAGFELGDDPAEAWDTCVPDPRIAAMEEQVARLKAENAEARDRALVEAVQIAAEWEESAEKRSPDVGYSGEYMAGLITRDISALRSRPSPAPSEAVRERVARAILKAQPGSAPWDKVTAMQRGVLLGMAAAALAVLASEGERDG